MSARAMAGRCWKGWIRGSGRVKGTVFGWKIWLVSELISQLPLAMNRALTGRYRA